MKQLIQSLVQFFQKESPAELSLDYLNQCRKYFDFEKMYPTEPEMIILQDPMFFLESQTSVSK